MLSSSWLRNWKLERLTFWLRSLQLRWSKPSARQLRPSRPRMARSFRPQLEALEQRQLLETMASFDPVSGSLSLVGAAAGSTVEVEGMSNGSIGVLVNGQLRSNTPGGSSLDPALAGANMTTLRATLMLAALALLLSGVGQARAGLITNHAMAEGVGTGFDGTPQQSQIVSGPTFAFASASASGNGGSGTGSAQAEANLSNLVSASVSATGGGTGIGDAEWRDAYFLTAPAGVSLPKFLRFSFHVEGSLPDTTGNGIVGLQIGGGAGSVLLTVSAGAPQPPGVNTGGGTFGVDSLLLTASNFDVHYHIDFSVGPQGIGMWDDFFEINYNAPTDGSFGGGFDPVQLTKITLLDGNTPEFEGFTLSFDSGLSSPNEAGNLVPEPASLTLLTLGSLGLLGYGWRPRRQCA